MAETEGMFTPVNVISIFAVLALVAVIFRMTMTPAVKASPQKKEKKNEKKAEKKADKKKAGNPAKAMATQSEAVEEAVIEEKKKKIKGPKKETVKDINKKAEKGAKKDAPTKEAEKPEEDEEDAKQQKKAKEVVADDGIDHGDSAADGDWEVASAVPKKRVQQQQRKAEVKAMEKAAMAQMTTAKQQQAIPGLAPAHQEGKKEAKGQGVQGVKAAAPLELTPQQEKAAEAEGNMKTATVKVPENCIGRVIGPKGATIKLVQEKAGLTRVDTTGEVFTLMGPPKAVALAEMAIEELVKKGYTSLAFENFSQAFVMVHPTFFPTLIGKQGCIIRKIKEELGAEIELPQTPQVAGGAGKATSKVKVTIAGSAEAVTKAKDVINELLTTYHSELTHPGLVHDEVEVEPWQLNFIIGKKGSEIKHIQANFKVSLNIPNEHSLHHNTLIVGEPKDVERAKAYIEKLIWNSDQPRGRGAADKADDFWGEEEDHEAWMDSYLYKRK